MKYEKLIRRILICEIMKQLQATYAFLTSSRVRGPEALKPRASLSEVISGVELSDSFGGSSLPWLWFLQFQELQWWLELPGEVVQNFSTAEGPNHIEQINWIVHLNYLRTGVLLPRCSRTSPQIVKFIIKLFLFLIHGPESERKPVNISFYIICIQLKPFPYPYQHTDYSLLWLTNTNSTKYKTEITVTLAFG